MRDRGIYSSWLLCHCRDASAYLWHRAWLESGRGYPLVVLAHQHRRSGHSDPGRGLAGCHEGATLRQVPDDGAPLLDWGPHRHRWTAPGSDGRPFSLGEMERGTTTLTAHRHQRLCHRTRFGPVDGFRSYRQHGIPVLLSSVAARRVDRRPTRIGLVHDGHLGRATRPNIGCHHSWLFLVRLSRVPGALARYREHGSAPRCGGHGASKRRPPASPAAGRARANGEAYHGGSARIYDRARSQPAACDHCNICACLPPLANVTSRSTRRDIEEIRN